MHELSIAVSLVEAACEKAAELGDVRVQALHLKLGTFSGVAKEALLFSWGVATEGTEIAGARLEVEDVPLVVFCAACDAERRPDEPYLVCPVCGAPTPTIVTGQELELFAMEVEDVEDVEDRAEAPHR